VVRDIGDLNAILAIFDRLLRLGGVPPGWPDDALARAA
jgi:hypothetical protein